jgi:hypothetical protein
MGFRPWIANPRIGDKTMAFLPWLWAKATGSNFLLTFQDLISVMAESSKLKEPWFIVFRR